MPLSSIRIGSRNAIHDTARLVTRRTTTAVANGQAARATRIMTPEMHAIGKLRGRGEPRDTARKIGNPHTEREAVQGNDQPVE